MAKGKKSSKSNQEHYKNYRYESNRKERLEKLLKQQPNNEQLKAALSNIHYRRQKPKSKQWSPEKRELAQLHRSVKRQYIEPKKAETKYGLPL